jgi:hypothetical protein
MTAAAYNITIEQGATYRQLLTLKDNSGVSVDISLYQFSGSIKSAPGGTALASFTFATDVGSDAPEADKTIGQIYMTLPAEDSAAIVLTGAKSFRTVTILQYDVEMTDTDNNIFRILNGTVAISPEITTDVG